MESKLFLDAVEENVPIHEYPVNATTKAHLTKHKAVTIKFLDKYNNSLFSVLLAFFLPVS